LRTSSHQLHSQLATKDEARNGAAEPTFTDGTAQGREQSLADTSGNQKFHALSSFKVTDEFVEKSKGGTQKVKDNLEKDTLEKCCYPSCLFKDDVCQGECNLSCRFRPEFRKKSDSDRNYGRFGQNHDSGLFNIPAESRDPVKC
jgi:hypothetical protein